MTLTRFVTTNGAFAPGSKALVDALLARLAEADEPRLVLFFHGGLVNLADGNQSAIDFADNLSALTDDGWEVAAPIWQSGLGETIRDNWAELEQEPRFNRLIYRIILWLERKFGDRMIAGALTELPQRVEALDIFPKIGLPEAEQLRAALGMTPSDLDRALHAESLPDDVLAEDELAQDILADTELVAMLEAGQPLMDRRIVEMCRTAQLVRPASAKKSAAPLAARVIAIKAARIGWKVARRFIDGRDHGIGPTVVEEVLRGLYLAQAGATIWGQMKESARQHFEGSNSGAYLLAGLSDIARTGKEVQLLAVGHSAGSLFCGRLALATQLAPAKLKVGHILLAPAIALDEATDVYARGRYDGLRIFTMNDAREQDNALDGNTFGKIYKGSLLYLISGTLENQGNNPDAPILGMQRHLAPRYPMTPAENAAFKRLQTVLDTLSVPLVFAPSSENAPAGQRTDSRRHGRYWDEPQTVESMIAIARGGFGVGA